MIMSIRPVKRVSQSQPTLEGAGVHLRRAFGFGDTSDFDPFLLLDDFRNDKPENYRVGFPWHPHRGIETITYVLEGKVEHGDSLGHRGIISSGDIQWMTAGSGIVHQEMPQGDSRGHMYGFQLWANLPAALKMTAPRYQEIKSDDIPVVKEKDGTEVRVVCGRFGKTTGPVQGVAADPTYLDVFVSAGNTQTIPIAANHNAFAYVFGGNGEFGEPEKEADDRTLVVFGNGDEISVRAGKNGIRFLLVSGKPLNEAIAWYGPIVMNTQAELQKAFQELENGTFLKENKAG
jgi:redox-sensitive bicupin YhaK (pirin superfamily)